MREGMWTASSSPLFNLRTPPLEGWASRPRAQVSTGSSPCPLATAVGSSSKGWGEDRGQHAGGRSAGTVFRGACAACSLTSVGLCSDLPLREAS